MNDFELYSFIEEERFNGSGWKDIKNKLSDLYQIHRSKGAWRAWFSRRKNGITNFTEKNLGHELNDDDPPYDIMDKVWEGTNLDPNEWEPEKISTWGDVENLRVSAKFKKREFPSEEVFKNIELRLNKKWEIKKAKTKDGVLLIPALFDAHIGKLSAINTEDYFLSVLQDLVDRTIRSYGVIEQVLFPVGQDFSHIDNVDRATSKGTPQETNATYADIISTQVTIAVKAVEFLAEQFPVHVSMVPGNHDRLSNEWLGHVIKGRFHNHSNVTVDGYNGTYEPRKYYVFGETMFAITHGNEENLNTIGNLIATEMRSKWGQTSKCEVLLGHLHTLKDKIYLTDERNGIILRYMPSISGTDTWHKLKGFVDNGRGGLGLVYSKKYGWKDTYFSPLAQFVK